MAVEGRLQIRSYDDQNGIRERLLKLWPIKALHRARDGGSFDDDVSAGPPEPEFDDVPF